MTADEFNLDNRILCSDGTCIGVVGEDGKCKVCGLAYEGGELLPSPAEHHEEAPSVESAELKTDGGEMKGSGAGLLDETHSEDRVCCSDEMCIGIMGQDGNCGTCGKRYSPENV